MTPKPNGSFCWADLMPADQPRAIAFYSALAGWHAGEASAEFGNYTMQFLGTQEHGNAVAGIAGAMDGVPPVWNGYFAADDFAATQAAIEAAGGTEAMPPFEVPGSGIGGFFADPTGAVFGVWQSKGHDGFGPWGEHGTFTWAEVYTGEARRSAEFFAAAFGLTVHPLAETEDFTYFQMKGDASPDPLFGIMQKGPSFSIDVPPVLSYLRVDDTDAAAATVTANGGEIVREPFDSPFGRVALVKDAEGATLAVVDPTKRAG